MNSVKKIMNREKGIRKMLRYKVIGNNVISVDLQNDYEIIAIAKWDKTSHSYTVNFMIKQKTVDIWDAINNDKTENIEFKSDVKTVNRDMAEYITALSKTDLFDYYINRYDYMMKCFDRGNELYEQERLGV